MYSTRREIRGVFEENKGDGAEVSRTTHLSLGRRTLATEGTQEPITP